MKLSAIDHITVRRTEVTAAYAYTMTMFGHHGQVIPEPLPPAPVVDTDPYAHTEIALRKLHMLTGEIQLYTTHLHAEMVNNHDVRITITR